MGYSCVAERPVITEFLDKAQKWFPNRNRQELKTLLGLYFENEKLVPDATEFANYDLRDEGSFLDDKLINSLPTKKQLKALEKTGGVMSKNRKARQSQTSESIINTRNKMVRAFTTAQRLDHIAMISRQFQKYISNHKPENLTRQEYLSSIGGVEGLFEKIKTQYARMSEKTWWIKQYNKIQREAGLPTMPVNPSERTEEQTSVLESIDVRADAYKKIVENFGALAMEALGEIQRLEEIRTDYYGVSFEDAAERQKEDEEDSYKENVVKGDNYNKDYRTESAQDTLAIVVERVLNSIPLYDENGEQVTNYIGYKRFVNPLRIHGYLSTLVEGTINSDHMMQRLREEAKETPWVTGLLERLDGDYTAQTAVFNNYKTVTTRYENVYKKKGKLQVGEQNSMDKRNAALRNLSSTMLSGIVLQKGTSIYDGNGNLVSDKEHLDKIKDLFTRIKELKKTAIKGTNKVDNLDKRQEWLDSNPDALKTMLHAIRSLGFNVTDKNVLRLFTATDLSREQIRRWKSFGGDYAVLNQLGKAYDAFISSVNKEDTPEDFVGKNSKVLRTLSSMLGVVAYDDVETRALVEGKSYATHTTPNLLHQIADELIGIAQGDKVVPTDSEGFVRYIWDRFGKYEGFHLGENRMIGWLSDVGISTKDSGLFQVIDVLDSQIGTKKEPDKWSKLDRFKVDYSMYHRQSGTGRRTAYTTPIMSDYGVYNAITGPAFSVDIYTIHNGEKVYNLENELLKRYVDEVKAEMVRMDRIAKTTQQDPKSRVVMETYEREGARFHLFPAMNSDKTKETYDALCKKPGGGVEAEEFLARRVAEHLDKYVQEKIQQYKDEGLFKEDFFDSFLDKKDSSKLTEDAFNDLQGFFLNELYAQYQIAKIFFGGEHFYKNVDEYHKRGMFAHGPRTAVDTSAKWDDGSYVLDRSRNESYNVAIIEDQILDSSYIGNIVETYDKAVEAGIITESQKKQYLKSWTGITTTDGQAFRSLDSFREVEKMADKGMWTEKEESAYQALRNGDITPEVMDVLQSATLAQNLKTLATGFSDVDTGTVDEFGNPVIVRQPFMYKHSEAVMFAPYIAEALRKKMPQYSSPVLRAIGEFMKEKDVQVVEFHSCVKMGDTGVISYNKETDDPAVPLDVDTIKERLAYQYDNTPGAKHPTPYKYYGIASSTPVDYADTTRSFSSQAVKMTFNDIQDGDEAILPNGKVVKSKDLKKLFYEIYAEDIQDAWNTLVEQFRGKNNKEQLEALLQQELASKSYNSRDLKYALSLIQAAPNDLQFVIPLISPATTKIVQNLLTSIIRNRLGKERTKGGNLIQQTALGFDRTIHYTEERPEGWRPLNIVFSKESGNLDAVEVYAPIHDKRLLKYADETGAISPERLEQLCEEGIIDRRILEFVAYRTPTDGIHATIPCRIVGFLPRATGGNIIMPSEMMVLTGNDFDIDKMLCHFKDFYVSYWDNEKLHNAYKMLVRGKGDIKDLGDAMMVISSLTPAQIKQLQKGELTYKEFRKAIREDVENPAAERFKRKDPVIQYIEYDYDSTPGEQSKEARNNAEIELIFANITSKTGTMRFMIPGGFEGIKQRAYTNWLLTSKLPSVKKSIEKRMKENGYHTKAELRDKYMLNLTSKDLANVVSLAKTGSSAYDIYERHTAHSEIMAGRALISRYALYNSGLALLQGSGVSIKPLQVPVYNGKSVARDEEGNVITEDLPMGLFGKYTFDKLDGIYDQGDEGKRSLRSTTLAQLISAAVDNRNNPILSFLNQNEATVGLTLTMVAAEIPIDTIITIMSQPIVWQFAKIKSENPYSSTSSILEAIIAKESEMYQTPQYRNVLYTFPQGYKSAMKRLREIDESDLVEHLDKDLSYNDEDFIKDQLAVAYLLMGLSPAAEDLSSLISCLRPENIKNGAGPYIGSTIINSKRVEDFISKIQSGSCALGFGGDVLTCFMPELSDSNTAKTAREACPILPMTTLMNSLMLYGSSQLLSPHLIMSTPNWRAVTKRVADLYSVNRLKDTVVRSIQDEMILWKLMKNTALTTDDMKADRKDLVFDLPKRLKAVKSLMGNITARLSKEDTAKNVTDAERQLSENNLLQKLWVTKASETQIPRIQLRLGGVLSEKITTRLRDAWDELLNINDIVEVTVDDEKIELNPHDLAIQLFKYNLYTDGFGYNQYTISQMAPPTVQIACPGYIDALRNLDNPDAGDFTDEEVEEFITQYIQNHWYNSRLVPRVEDEAWEKMVIEDTGDTVILKKHIEGKGADLREYDPNKYWWNSGFMLHTTEDGATLYRIEGVTQEGGLILSKYPILGNIDASRQVGLQYEPNEDPKGIQAIQRGLYESLDNYSWDADREIGLTENNIEAHNPYDDEGNGEMTAKRVRQILLQKAFGLFGTEVTEKPTYGKVIEEKPDTPENTQELTAKAVEQNDKSEGQDTATQSTEVKDSLSEKLIDTFKKNISFYNLVRHTTDENGKPVVQIVAEPASAASVREARNQKLNLRLNRRLRKILADAGIGVGVLNDFERELGAAGVTDFSVDRTIAEGLVEMIRLANNEEGEASLPEEFSHVALAMLGPGNQLVQRLMNSIDDTVIEEVLGDAYEDYYNAYGGNRHRLAFEAAGKLVAKHLLDNEPIPQKPYKSLLQRVIDWIKKTLRKINRRELQAAIAEAEEAADSIAKGILEGDLADLMIMDNIEETTQYFDIVQNIEDNGNILKRVLQRDIKRYDLLDKKTKNRDEERRESILGTARKLITKMDEAVRGDKQDVAISDYLKETLEFLGKCDNGLTRGLNSAVNANTFCKRLRLDRDIIYSFKDTLKDLRAYARQNPGVLSSTTMSSLAQAQTLLTEFYERYHEAAMQQYTDWIRSVMGDQMVVGIGRKKGTVIRAEEVAQTASSDISMINRWLDSMADQPDMLNKLFDESARRYKDKVRRLDIDMRVRIDAAFSAYYKATGSRDQSFMFERKDGKRTGKYISEKAAENLNDAQRKYYNEMMAIKKELDLFLPVKNHLKTIKIRKDLLDQVRSSGDMANGFRNVWQSIQDKVLVRSDDEEYLTASSIVDFEGNKVDLVPLYYINLGKGESEEDVSEDVASTMLAYAHMAYNYKELNGIIDILENARSMAQERRVVMKRGGKMEKENIVVNPDSSEDFYYEAETYHTKAQKQTKIGQMLDDFFSMQVYNHMRVDSGNIGVGKYKISKQKAADELNAITSLSTMALNLNQRISNVTVGEVQILEEAAAREFFKPGTLAKATAFYVEHLPEMMGQAGAQTNTSFLSLLDEMFDITQENAGRFRDRQYRKNAFEKNANTGLLTLGLAWGENLMSMSTAISILMEYEVLSPDGKTKVPILQALEKSFADSKNKSGAKMVLKDGYTKLDGTAITNDDIYNLTKKIGGVNHKLQGIYNTNDKNMVEAQWWGVLIMMFRKWMVPNIRRRYGGANYDFMTESWVEGFYVSLYNFIRANISDWIKETHNLKAAVTMNWNKLSPEEKANIRRAVTELGTSVGVLMSLMLLGRIHMEDDDEGKSFSDWLYNMTYYQLMRLKTEIMAQVPNPQMVKEGLKLLAEPFAGLKTIENSFEILHLLNPLEAEKNFKTEIQSGRYKGHTYAYKYFMQFPIVSMGRQIERAIDPSDLINYYKK